jgi:hypothetical protein
LDLSAFPLALKRLQRYDSFVPGVPGFAMIEQEANQPGRASRNHQVNTDRLGLE